MAGFNLNSARNLFAPDASQLVPDASAAAAPSGGGLFGGGDFFNSEAWPRLLMGLALLDAGKPQVNPPPLMQSIAPMLQMAALAKQQKQDQQFFNYLTDPKRRPSGGMPWDAPIDSPSAAATPASGETAAPAIPATGASPFGPGGAGNSGMLAGGALSGATSAALSGDYASLIKAAADQNGLPPDIFAKQIAQESSFNPNAKSPAGALGIAQFMPGTARRFGIDPLDPKQAIPAAAQYVAQNRDLFGGNLGLALAGYNWGEGNVQKWLQRGANPGAMPSETRAYVANITGKPIDVWLNAGTAAAQPIPTDARGAAPQPIPTDVGGARTQFAQAGPPTMSDAATSDSPIAATPRQAIVQATQQGLFQDVPPRDLARAHSLAPTTPPPPAPNTVEGATTQKAVAQKWLGYWLNNIAVGSLLGDRGKGFVEAAKVQIDLAKPYLTPTEFQRELMALPPDMRARATASHFLANDPAQRAAVAQAEAAARVGPALTQKEGELQLQQQYGPATAGLTTAAQKQAELGTAGPLEAAQTLGKIAAQVQAMGGDIRTPQGQAMARGMVGNQPDVLKLLDAMGIAGTPAANRLIEQAIPGQAPTGSMKESEVLRTGTPEEKAALREAAGLNRPQTTINNVTNPIVGAIGASFTDQRKAADSAVDTINSIHDARQQLDRGIVSGPGADPRAYLARVGELFGIPPETAANTAAFKSALGTVTLSIAKQLGSGQGITNADRDFAERMAGGQLDLGESAIRHVLDIREKAERYKISKYQATADRLLNQQNAPDVLKEIAPLITVQQPPEYKPPEVQQGTAQQQPAPVQQPAAAAPPGAARTGSVPSGMRPMEYDGAVAKLKANPTRTNQFYFDQAYGVGAAAKALGR